MSAAPRVRFNLPLIALHWLTLLLIAGAYLTSELREAFEDTPTEAVIDEWHALLGLTVLGLAALRIAVRAVSRTPPIEPPPPRWQARIATLVHLALYGLMLLLPLTGWLMLNADGETARWFGQALPALIGPSRRLAHTLEDIHEALANAGYFLIGLHAAAALFHHYVARDNTLRLMVPGWGGMGR
jgi:superoxide oxidase